MVPFRDQVIHWATGRHVPDHFARVAKRNAAIHATRALFLQKRIADLDEKFVPIFDSLGGIALTVFDTVKFHKSCWLTHRIPLF